MAASRVTVTLTSTAWTLVELDPDTDGYTKMLVDKINTNHSTTQWSTINTITEDTSVLPDETSIFDYDIYVRNKSASADDPITLAITRL